MKMSDYIAGYEKQIGKPVEPVVVYFAKGVDRICSKAERMGAEDANKGNPAYSAEDFRARTAKNISGDKQLIDLALEFIYDAYLTGYRRKEEACV